MVIKDPGGYSTKFYTGEAPSEVQPLTLIYTIFDRKGISFIPSIHKWYPFHIPCLELCIPFTTVNALFFKFEYITKRECFLDIFTDIKNIC